MENEIKLSVAVKAIIANENNEVLIVQESAADSNVQTGLWGFAGGKIKANEPFEAGLRREVKEETGLEAFTVRDPIYLGEWWPKVGKMSRHIIGIFVRCEVAGTPSVKLSEEHDDYAWVTASSAINYQLMTPDDKALEAFFKQQSR